MSSHMYARPKQTKCKGNEQMQVSQLPSEPLSYFPMTIHTLFGAYKMQKSNTKSVKSDVRKVWSNWCRTSTPLNLTGKLPQWHKLTQAQMNEVSPPTPQHSKDRDFPCLQHGTHIHTHSQAHTQRKRSPLVGTHAVGRVMADLTRPRQTFIHPYKYTVERTRAHMHTHTEHGQCNQCQLSLLSKAAMGLQSVIVTLPRHAHCLDFHSHVNACKHTKSKKTLPRYFMVICLVSGFAFTVFLWLRALRTTQFYPLWHVLHIYRNSNCRIYFLKFWDE